MLGAFPGKRFLIHIKSNDPDEGRRLAERLKSLPPEQLQRLLIYGGACRWRPRASTLDIPDDVRIHAEALPDPLSPARLDRYVPSDCERSVLLVPVNYAPWLWGWPNRLLDRMNEHGSTVFIIGRHDGEDFSSGIDRSGRPRLLPAGFAGVIWTNRIDRIAPAWRQCSCERYQVRV